MVLKFLRKKKTMKRIIWGLAIIIIPAFVVWGAGTSNKKRGKGPNYAGKIFNKKVSFDDYLNMWRVTRDSAIRSFGANIPVEVIDQLTWNRIILLEVAKRKRVSVKNDELVKNIASFPIFQRDGRFDKKLYKSMLGESARGFEERIRDDIRISKVKDQVTANISVTDEEVKTAYKKKFEKVKASYASIPFSDFEKYARYKESDLVEFYENNKQAFRKPEQINLRYIEVLLSGFDKEVFVTEDEIKTYFEEHISDYKKPDSDETPSLDKTIKKDISEKLSTQRKTSLAEELAYKVLDKVLEKKSLDGPAGSFSLKTKETGFFNMQEEIPGIGWSYAFTKKGFELKPDEISNILIKTDKGYCIIQLKEKKESYIPEFIEAKDTVRESFIKKESVKLSERKAKKIYLAITNKIKKGISFEDAITQVKLEAKETDFITRDTYIPELGPAKAFIDACMSLKNGEIARPVQMLENWAILKRSEYQGIDEIKFIEEKEGFKQELLSRKKEMHFNNWFQGLKKRANFVSYTLE